MSGKIDSSDKYLSTEEIRRLVDTIDDLEDKVLILLALETGLRRSEVVTIQTSNLDFERQTAKVYDYKKDEWRNVVYPMSMKSNLRMYLQSRRHKSPLLFPFSAKTANRKLKRWCTTAGIRIGPNGGTVVSFHWLRHTFIRRSKMVGRDIKVVQQNTGDTIETILKYYRNLSIEDRIAELEAKPLMD